MALHRAMDSTRYAAFGGCGCKGVTYLGWMMALQEPSSGSKYREWQAGLVGACGSSSGCVAALALVVNADARTLLDRWQALNIESIAAHAYLDLSVMMTRYGADTGDTLRRVLGELFAACGLATDTTFATLHRLTRKDLRVCATNLNRMRVQVFSHTLTPDVPVLQAMYWSMCVPYVFAPEKYNGDTMIDGCALAYVPLDVFPIAETLVVYTRRRRLERMPTDSLRNFSLGVLHCCSVSVLRRVDELRARHPDSIFEIAIFEDHDDVFLSMSKATMRSLTSIGYANAVTNLDARLGQLATTLLRVALHEGGERKSTAHAAPSSPDE